MILSVMLYQPNIHSATTPQLTVQLQRVKFKSFDLHVGYKTVILKTEDECIGISEQQVIKW